MRRRVFRRAASIGAKSSRVARPRQRSRPGLPRVGPQLVAHRAARRRELHPRDPDARHPARPLAHRALERRDRHVLHLELHAHPPRHAQQAALDLLGRRKARRRQDLHLHARHVEAVRAVRRAVVLDLRLRQLGRRVPARAERGELAGYPRRRAPRRGSSSGARRRCGALLPGGARARRARRPRRRRSCPRASPLAGPGRRPCARRTRDPSGSRARTSSASAAPPSAASRRGPPRRRCAPPRAPSAAAARP